VKPTDLIGDFINDIETLLKSEEWKRQKSYLRNY
jgi:hypothetical protein